MHEYPVSTAQHQQAHHTRHVHTSRALASRSMVEEWLTSFLIELHPKVIESLGSGVLVAAFAELISGGGLSIRAP